MKQRSNPFLRSILATAVTVLAVSTARAIDYNFGAIGSGNQPFKIDASDAARDESGDGFFNNNNTPGDMGIYWRGSSSDVTFLHFDLSSLAGKTLNGSTNLNYTVNANWGGNTTGSQISTANSAWTYSFGGAAPAYTAVPGAINATGNFGSGQVATWGIGQSTFQGYVDTPSSFHGLVLSGASGTTAHFSGTATLIGNYNGYDVEVLGATDWSAASFDSGSTTLTISGSNTVTGGNVKIGTGATLAVVDAATLDSGNFTGTIVASGKLAIGSSSNQMLSGVISGGGNLEKSGSGTLVLDADNTRTGLTSVAGGTLQLNKQNSLGAWGSHILNISGGGTVVTDWGVDKYNDLGPVTLGAAGQGGGTLASNQAGLWNLGNFVLYGDVTVAAGSTSTSVISSDVRCIYSQTRNFDVGVGTDASGIDLLISGKIGHYNGNSWGYMNKAGDGTLKIAGTNELGGITVSAGKLILENGAISLMNVYGIRNNALAELSVTAGTISWSNNSLKGSGTYFKTGGGTLETGGFALENNVRPTVTVDNGTLQMTGGHNNYWDVQSTTINTGAKLGNGTHSHIRGLTFAGGELSSTGYDGTWGGWMFDENITVTAGTGTSTLSANQVAIANASNVSRVFDVGSGSTLNVTGNFIDANATTNNGLTKDGDGAMILANANSHTGPTLVSAGTLTLSHALAIQNSALDTDGAGAVALSGVTSPTFGGLTGSGDLAAVITSGYGGVTNLTLNPGSGRTYVHSGIIADGAPGMTLTKTGTGQQILSGANTYAGGTIISNGTLVFTNTAAKPATGTISVAAGAALGLGVGGTGYFSSADIDNLFAGTYGGVTLDAASTLGIDTTAGDFIYGSSIPATTLGLVKLGPNTLTLTGTNAYTGATVVNGGTLFVPTTASLPGYGTPGLVTVNGGATLAVAAGGSGWTSTDIDSLRTNATWSNNTAALGIDTTNGDFTYASAITQALGLTKTGLNTLTLSGANTYTGATRVLGGTLKYEGGVNHASGSHFIASGAVLEMNVTASGRNEGATTSFTGAGTLRKTGPGEIIWGPATATFALGSGSLIDVQEGMITGGSYGNENWSNNLSDLNVAAGTYFHTVEANVRVDAITGSGTITSGYNGAGYQNLTIGVDGGSGTFHGTIANGEVACNLVKTGTGTIILAGTNTYTGSTTVNEGILSLAQPTLGDASTVAVVGDGVLDLSHGAIDYVGTLVLGTATYTSGLFDAANSDGRITGSGRIQVGPEPFLDWIGPFGVSDPSPEGDPDNDGIKNLVEYILQGGDPSASSTGILPTVDASGVNFVFTFFRRIDATGTTQTFQYGTDLSGWTDVPVTNGGMVAITSPEAGIEQVVITVPKAGNTELFGRLQVVK